jgi:hypothetical protein
MVEVSAENITLVTVVSFLSLFFILLALVPHPLLANPQQGRVVNVPEYFEALDLNYFSETKNFTLGTNYVRLKFTLGGWNLQFDNDPVFRQFSLCSYDSWWIFTWGYESFTWYNVKGVKVSENFGTGNWQVLKWDQLNPNYDMDRKLCEFTVQNSKTQLKVYFAFNTTKYNTPYDALVGGELHVLFCVSMDKVNTSINAWNLIGSILFFQMPNVHPLINAIIAIPVWIAIAWLIYILILKAIPFVGG